MNNWQNGYHFGMTNYNGYNHFLSVNPQYSNQQLYPNPNQLLVYGPYQEGPSSQVFPPDWFGYYAQANPYLNPSNVPDIAYYLNPQFLPTRW